MWYGNKPEQGRHIQLLTNTLIHDSNNINRRHLLSCVINTTPSIWLGYWSYVQSIRGRNGGSDALRYIIKIHSQEVAMPRFGSTLFLTTSLWF